MADNIIPNGNERTARLAALPPLTEVAHAQSAELMNVLTLLHIAIDEASECTFRVESSTDSSGITDRHSRLVSILGMSKDRVAELVNKLDPYI